MSHPLASVSYAFDASYNSWRRREDGLWHMVLDFKRHCWTDEELIAAHGPITPLVPGEPIVSEPYEHRAPTRSELIADLNDLANWLVEESTNADDAPRLARWSDAVGEAAASLLTDESETP